MGVFNTRPRFDDTQIKQLSIEDAAKILINYKKSTVSTYLSYLENHNEERKKGLENEIKKKYQPPIPKQKIRRKKQSRTI